LEEELGLPDVPVPCPVTLRQRTVVYSAVVLVNFLNLLLCYEYLLQLRELLLHLMS
jgi:hypothetical protein